MPSLQNCWWDLLRADISVPWHIMHDQHLVDFSMGRARPATREVTAFNMGLSTYGWY